jgi:hypothetical protein
MRMDDKDRMTRKLCRLMCLFVCLFVIASVFGPAHVWAEDDESSVGSQGSNQSRGRGSIRTETNVERGGAEPLDGDSDGDGILDVEERGALYISRRFSFEFDSENWIAEGLWERSEMLSYSPKSSFHCRRELWPPINYLTSPFMEMPNVDMSEVNRLQVSFWYFAEFLPDPNEYGELQVNDGSGWSALKVYDSTGPSQSMPFDIVDITDYAGQNIQLRFKYNQVPISSPLLGWFIDEVRIVGYTNPNNKDTDADIFGTDQTMIDGAELSRLRTSYRSSFESNEQGWTYSPSGSWERTTERFKSKSHSFHAVRDGTQTTIGTLTSPVIQLPMSPTITLKFSYWLDAFSADMGKVGVKVIGGGGHWENPVYRTEMGNNPFALCVGDADNDGDNDIVVQADPYYVYIYKWEGDDWADPIVRGVGGSARQIFIGDVDNDGYNDIVVATGGYYGIRILRWNGVDDWEDLFLPGTGGEPLGLFVADADNDNDNDIVISDYSLNTVSILPWEGADWGTWSSIPVGNQPVAVFVADIDGDNDNDIAVANQGDDTVMILVFPGWAPETLAVGDYPNSIFVNDVDDDGDMDIVTPNYFDDTVSILEQRPGQGWFRDDRDVGTHPASISIEDVDEDGDNDIVVSDQHSHTISILRWVGSDWNPRETLDVFQYPAGVCVADADNDGDNDIINTNLLPGSVSIFKWTGNPNFQKSYTIVDNTVDWEDESLDVSEFADDYIQIVFQYTSFQDGGVTQEGWYIDDVSIVANTNLECGHRCR